MFPTNHLAAKKSMIKNVVVTNQANPLQSSSNSHLSEKFRSLNPKLRSYKSLATTYQLHSAAKWELPEREREEMKTENLWGIFFPQQKNFFNFQLMINQQKHYHPIDKIKSQKTTKKQILGFSNKTAIL